MPFFERFGVVAAKLEAVEGTDAINDATTGGTDTHLIVRNITCDPDGEEIDRDVISPHGSPLGKVVGARWGSMEFETELRGRGAVPTALTPLRENPLYVGCGFTPTYTAGTATYKNKTSLWSAAANATVSLYGYLNGILHVFTGSRGTFGINGEAGRFGTIRWRFQGIWRPLTGTVLASAGIIDQADPTYAPDNFSLKPPPFLGVSLTTHGYATAFLHSFSWENNGEVVRRDNAQAAGGVAGMLLVDRKPGGTMAVEAVTRATHDFWQRWQNATEGVITCTVGNGVGNTVAVSIAAGQYGKPRYGTRNKIRTFEMPYSANAASAAGDDDTSIIYT